MTGDPQRILLPPFCVRRNFLPAPLVADLLGYAIANDARFAPSRVGNKTIDPTQRISSLLRDLGPFEAELKTRIRPLTAGLVAELKVSPFTLKRLEIELVAHNDGAFLARHIDTQYYDDTAPAHRILSAVYYFHAMPKAFSGGALRLHEVLPGGGHYADVEPTHNTLVVFPSWAPHEVLNVSCPSRAFQNSRFAINCWFRGS